MAQVSGMFRQTFTLPSKDVLRWFPGHMYKGMERIQATLKDIDCVIEVHDSRIPFSGRNPRFRDILRLRPHVLLLNKLDLADLDTARQSLVKTRLHSEGIDSVYFTDLRQFQQSKFLKSEILPAIINLTESRPRFSRKGLNEYNIMVIGVPNVGKSTFINTVRWANIKRKGRAAAVGSEAGITKSVASKIKVNAAPPVYIIDTPGIFTPQIPDVETGMRLALCACLPDCLVEEETIADYLLFRMNKMRNFAYTEVFEIPKATDNILDVLAHIAIKNKKVLKVRDFSNNSYKLRPDFKEAGKLMIRAYRDGTFGRTFLDEDRLN
ncbi:mitochondrial ribosome-associated GTPase 1-like [Haliotis asinina]|uniref:mitochondrial ribosome-associated GTPase 1-like n=1 Tax=Haliotis asinina TaxID=109174 RepID=UPI0035326C6B